MFSQEFVQSNLFNWVVLPLLIFCARSCDVTLGTLRNIFLSKNIRYIVPFLGFIEVLIWLLAVTQIIKNLTNVMCYVAFAGGYSMGIFLGIKIEERLALGMQILRIITHQNADSLVQNLKHNNFGVTIMDAQGSKGPVKILLTVIKRKDRELVAKIINEHNPNAFYSIEDIRMANQGVFPRSEGESKLQHLKRVFPGMKSF
ncbi:MAG: DUF2179 domain-containing protein [Bacteroidia bacterium]